MSETKTGMLFIGGVSTPKRLLKRVAADIDTARGIAPGSERATTVMTFTQAMWRPKKLLALAKGKQEFLGHSACLVPLVKAVKKLNPEMADLPEQYVVVGGSEPRGLLEFTGMALKKTWHLARDARRLSRHPETKPEGARTWQVVRSNMVRIALDLPFISSVSKFSTIEGLQALKDRGADVVHVHMSEDEFAFGREADFARANAPDFPSPEFMVRGKHDWLLAGPFVTNLLGYGDLRVKPLEAGCLQNTLA